MHLAAIGGSGGGWMRWAALSVLAVAFFGPHQAGLAAPAPRQKAGPVTIRGIVHQLHADGFALSTTHHGTYSVRVFGATNVSEKHRRGRVSLQNNDHVGVHGFVRGRTIRAIRIRIYPIKPKPFTLRGSVAGIGSTSLTLNVNGRVLHIRVTSHTIIKVGRQRAALAALFVGQVVAVRVLPVHGLTAEEIRARKPVLRHVRVKGVVSGLTVSSMTVRSGVQTYFVGINGRERVYLGGRRASAGVLKAGQSVTVYACCAGHTLVATSIHIHRTLSVRASLSFRGQVTSISAGQMVIATGGGRVFVSLQSSTSFKLGIQKIGWSNIHIGDSVSVRAYRSGGSLIAARVHVYVSGRRPVISRE